MFVSSLTTNLYFRSVCLYNVTTLFFVASYSLIYVQFTHQQMHFFILKNTLKLHENILVHKYRSYMFRFSTIISELALNLAKVIFMLKHLVKLRRYLL